MNYSLVQIIEALENLCILGGDKDTAVDKLRQAQELLKDALKDLDGLTVGGRSAIDTLLGCMMAIESIAGVTDGE